jgi:chromosome partitioning protein
MRSISLINQKGGVGKTTSTANLGASLAMLGKRVLLVDVDPQANLSVHFGINIHDIEKSVYHLIMSEAPFEEVVQKTELPGLDIVPSQIALSGAEIQLVGMVGRETILRDALAPADGHFDYMLIDCPPSLGLLTLNALTTVKEVIIPLQTEFFALEGMSHLLKTVELVKKRINHELQITGIIACMYDARTSLAKAVHEKIREYFGNKVFKTVIRKNIRLAESPSHGQPITLYDPEAMGASDYLSLAKEVIAQETPAPATAPTASPQVATPTPSPAPAATASAQPAAKATQPTLPTITAATPKDRVSNNPN